MKEFFQEVQKRILNEEEVMLITIANSSGSAPRGAGAKMAVCEDGSSFGTIGGGAVEFQSGKKAEELLQEKRSHLQEFCLAPNQAADLGMVCGGDVLVHFQYLTPSQEIKQVLEGIVQLEQTDQDSWLVTHVDEAGTWNMAAVGSNYKIIAKTQGFRQEIDFSDEVLGSRCTWNKADRGNFYVQPLKHAGKVYIFGGGHITQQLVPVLNHVFFACTVIDSSEQFSNPELFPLAKETKVMNFDKALEGISIRERDYIIVVTRGHQFDYEVLIQALKTSAGYIGMIGSKRKVGVTYERLYQNEGYSKEDTDRIYAPIGLDLGGRTPEEIAISIAAQLIEVRAKKNGRQG